MMRNCKRPPCPATLEKEAQKWTDTLIKDITKCKKTGSKLNKSLSERYRTDDVKQALVDMYNGLCCYCESRIKDVTYEHIEHRKPKDSQLFPECCYEWDNLHLACPKCNTNKGNKWNDDAPILDAVADVPIEQHLTYEESATGGLLRWPLTERGETTRSHADLDRDHIDGLAGTRAQVYLATLKAIRKIRKCDSVQARNKRRELKRKWRGPYGSVIKWAMDELLDGDAD